MSEESDENFLPGGTVRWFDVEDRADCSLKCVVPQSARNGLLSWLSTSRLVINVVEANTASLE